MAPVGRTLYIWDGGWNLEDATRMGPNPQWEAFFREQDGSYAWEDHQFEHGNGLDCSGYLSWVLYNTFNTSGGGESFVCYARLMAASLAKRGFGELVPASEVRPTLPGDVFSNKEHCWLSLGACEDGSVLLLHSSPPGVHLGGTYSLQGCANSQAFELASCAMRTYYPEWSAQFAPKPHDYLGKYQQFRWDYATTLQDEEGLRFATAPEVLARLLPSRAGR